MSAERLDFLRTHADHHAESGGAVVERERSGRIGRSALPVMNLNMAALIDVVFLLMIYFMLITEFRRPEEKFDVDLPSRMDAGAGADPFALPDRPIIIGVYSTGDGQSEYVLEADAPALERAVTYESLFLAASRAHSETLADDQRFVIQSAPDARWEHALGTFNAIRRAGFTEVRFARPGFAEGGS